MHRIRLIILAWLLSPWAAHAAFVTISNANSSLKFSIDEPNADIGSPSDPLQLPRTIEWTVDGRRILVYPSGPSTFLDIGHSHSGVHVAPNQIHGQGPMLGYASGATSGTVVGGVVYTVVGGNAGSGVSRISEKFDIHNKTGGNVSISLAGLGYKPTQASLEVPDLAGLNLKGTTLVFYQGNPQTGSITDSPFAPVTVQPVVAFEGFNPLFNQNLNLPAGAMLTMVTELKVGTPLTLVATPMLWILLSTAVLAAAAAGVVWRRRRSRQ